tara:strand:- start:8704 stop:9495 length:792 start_codon:yes stop_codon:yes gene_type:complete
MTWHFREYKAEGLLAEYIDCFWSENYMDRCESKQLMIFPDNTVELIFSENPFIRNGQRYLSHLSGLKTQSQMVAVERSPLVAVRFKPYGLKPFINCASQELLNGSFAPEEVFGPEIREIEEQLFEAVDFESRVQILSQYFLFKLKKQTSEKPFGSPIAAYISAQQGQATVQGLMYWSGLSLKSLERHFKKHFGLSPKQYLRLQRVLMALARTKADHQSSLTTIAYDFGYFDQAHFIHEVQSFTGLNPMRFRSELSDLQAQLFV